MKRASKENSSARRIPAAILALLLWTAGGSAWAQSFNINDGSVTITADGTYTITGTGTETGNSIKVNSGVTADITLENVNISRSDAFDMAGATVNLVLVGTNILKSGKNKAGLHVPAGATLTIDGSGTLNATGGDWGAGIGGNVSGAGGYITINGGTVTAHGADHYYGVGIGGGSRCTGGTITINGGTVKATGGNFATSIGGGRGMESTHHHHHRRQRMEGESQGTAAHQRQWQEYLPQHPHGRQSRHRSRQEGHSGKRR
jgi:hypothetical protein